MIAEIRKIYSGAITYDTNHGEEDRLKWWDAVDIIGISGYYPIGTGKIAKADEGPEQGSAFGKFRRSPKAQLETNKGKAPKNK